MSESPNKLIRFWQELKRRKVFKVVAMYAGTSFIILEVVNNLVSPLRLPEWTPTLVVVLLGIGFPIVAILSWIFDVTPEGLKKTESFEAVKKRKSQPVPIKRRLKASDIIIAVMAVVIVILLYPKIFKRDTLEKLRSSGERISVAVMPFQNMTNDTIWNVWQDGIQDIIIAYLSNSIKELKIRQTESINDLIQSKGFTNYASITPSVASTISQKLDANVFIYGSIKQAGTKIRLNAQLINSKTEETYKSFEIDGPAQEEMIFQIVDSLKRMVKNYLIISELAKELPAGYENYEFTDSPEAFRYFIYGLNAFTKRDYHTAIDLFTQSVIIDSNLYSANFMMSIAYYNLDSIKQGEKWCLKNYAKRNIMTIKEKISSEWLNALYFETPHEEIKYLRQQIELDDQVPVDYYNLGTSYYSLNQYDKTITECEKALEIYNKWGVKPMWILNYILPGIAYHKTRQFKKEKELYKKAEHDFPDDPELIYRQAVLALSEGKTKEAIDYIEKYKSILKDNSSSDADIATNLAGIYSEAEMLDKAEEYYRQALSLEPENPVRINSLAYFLIDKDRNINEGMGIVNKALELSPEDFKLLHTKGWGLYKQGKYKEAVELLQKSLDLRTMYNHELWLHLEAAKKAVAGQKAN